MFDLLGLSFRFMVLHAELHGYRKRWAAPSNRAEVPVSTGSPAAMVESEPGLASEGHRSEEDRCSLNAEFQSSASNGDSERSFPSQMSTQQTGIVTALSVLRSAKRVKLPWETGPLAPVFKRDSFTSRFEIKPQMIGLSDVLNPQPKVRAAVPAQVPSLSSHAAVRRRIVCTSYNVQDDELRSRALNRFKILVCMDLTATGIGKSMLNCVGNLDCHTDVLQVLEDSLASKATGTLLKRASSLWRWASWLVSPNKGICFDQTEATVYEYMNHLRDNRSAPTSASHFVEAVRFAEQVFKLLKVNVQTVLTSRVTGAAHNMFLQKRKLKQAPAFSVGAVSAFEDLCNHDERPHVRAICGSILFCIFACVRWFDAMRIESISLDKCITMALLEAATSKHKTSMTKETKTMLLPFTSLGRFLGSANWAESFMDARSQSGLHGQNLFLPSWNEVGQSWSAHPMSSGEATCWIRELLSSAGVEDYERFSSHSAKCTLLTWAGMTTLFTREERTLLGHHVEPQTKSATIYNRDSQIMLQYKVLKLINLIRPKKLKPDASRAERLAMMVENGSTGDPSELSEVVQEPEIEASDEDSQDVDLDEEDDPTTDLDGHLDAEREQVPEQGDEFLWYIHCFTGVVHAAQIVSLEDRLLCGRPITVNLVSIEVGGAEARTGLMCMQCNSVMKRHTGHDDYSEWERVSDERVELEEEL